MRRRLLAREPAAPLGLALGVGLGLPLREECGRRVQALGLGLLSEQAPHPLSSLPCILRKCSVCL